MVKRIRRFFHGAESGMTIIELVIGIGLAVAILPLAGTMVYQLFAIPQANSNSLQAILAVDNVGSWLIRDGQQAMASSVDISTVTVTGGTRKLRLSCQYTQDRHTVDYVLLNGNRLRRDDYLNDNTTPTSVILGQNITIFSVTGASGNYQVTVGATINGFMPRSTQLTYRFKPRL